MNESTSLKMGKRTEQVKLILAKANVPETAKMQVETVVDYSGSMDRMYRPENGTVQNTLERTAAIALRFDDDGELGVTAFSTKVSPITNLTVKNLEGYVPKVFTPECSKVRGLINGGTQYSLPVQVIIDKHTIKTTEQVEQKPAGLFGGMKSMFGMKDVVEVEKTSRKPGAPVFVMFYTDGQTNGDEAETERLIASNPSIYWLFIGIDPNRRYFEFLERLAKDYDHVGFAFVPKVETVTDEELYAELLKPEVLAWVKTATAQGN